MKTSSAKAKGRRACAEAREEILKYFPSLHPDDIQVTSSGANGEDLKLSPAARVKLPVAIEVKNQESISIWEALKQADSHAQGKNDIAPMLIFKRNKSELQVAMSLDNFLWLLTRKTITYEIPHDHISEIHT